MPESIPQPWPIDARVDPDPDRSTAYFRGKSGIVPG
jgi:hypothetical protein